MSLGILYILVHLAHTVVYPKLQMGTYVTVWPIVLCLVPGSRWSPFLSSESVGGTFLMTSHLSRGPARSATASCAQRTPSPRIRHSSSSAFFPDSRRASGAARQDDSEQTLKGHATAVACVDWSPDGQFLLSGADNGGVKVGLYTATAGVRCRGRGLDAS